MSDVLAGNSQTMTLDQNGPSSNARSNPGATTVDPAAQLQPLQPQPDPDFDEIESLLAAAYLGVGLVNWSTEGVDRAREQPWTQP